MNSGISTVLCPENFVYIVVQLLNHVWLFATPWTAACQASQSFPTFWSLLKLMSIESVMPSNHLILCHPPLLLPTIFPSFRVFSVNRLLASGGQSIGASASVLQWSADVHVITRDSSGDRYYAFGLDYSYTFWTRILDLVLSFVYVGSLNSLLRITSLLM